MLSLARRVPTKVAIPRFGEAVAPCFEYSATITIFTIRGSQVVDQTDFRLTSREPVDRVRLLRDQKVQTLICGGVRERFEYLVLACGIRVISWVSGNVDELLGLYLEGRLVSGTASVSGAPAQPFDDP
jgi:predicted Fe-Mo cluster-binding NifX family protein